MSEPKDVAFCMQLLKKSFTDKNWTFLPSDSRQMTQMAGK